MHNKLCTSYALLLTCRTLESCWHAGISKSPIVTEPHNYWESRTHYRQLPKLDPLLPATLTNHQAVHHGTTNNHTGHTLSLVQ